MRADTAIGLPFGKNQHLGAVEIPGHLHELGLPFDGAHRIFDILKDNRRLEDHDELGTRDRKIESLEVIWIVDGMHLEGGAALEGDQNVIGKLHAEADGIGACWHGELNLAVAGIRRTGIATPGASLEACLQAGIGLRDLHQQVGGIGLVQLDHRMGPACRIGLELDIGKGKFMESRRLAGHAGDHNLPDLLDLGLKRRGQRDRHGPGHRLAHVARQEELVAERYPVRPNCGCAGCRLDQSTAHLRTRVSARADTERTLVGRGFGGRIVPLFPIDGARPVFTGLIECRIGTRIDDEDQLFFTELTLQRLDDALLTHGAGREFDALEHHLRIEQVGLGLAEDRDIPGLVQSRVVDRSQRDRDRLRHFNPRILHWQDLVAHRDHVGREGKSTCQALHRGTGYLPAFETITGRNAVFTVGLHQDLREPLDVEVLDGKQDAALFDLTFIEIEVHEPFRIIAQLLRRQRALIAVFIDISGHSAQRIRRPAHGIVDFLTKEGQSQKCCARHEADQHAELDHRSALDVLTGHACTCNQSAESKKNAGHEVGPAWRLGVSFESPGEVVSSPLSRKSNCRHARQS